MTISVLFREGTSFEENLIAIILKNFETVNCSFSFTNNRPGDFRKRLGMVNMRCDYFASFVHLGALTLRVPFPLSFSLRSAARLPPWALRTLKGNCGVISVPWGERGVDCPTESCLAIICSMYGAKLRLDELIRELGERALGNLLYEVGLNFEIFRLGVY